ncbi:class I poly(R)-hydroxyalkanoic acid synthase [Halomonas sp. HP20-15]|uniref:class I poly(R)-hydroxyalkanoic acid synthase n=1 Tax=Halomonas sp. HP20-15 TaxID=3085901 RepID=UPI002980FC12|nr:class I poly(R)-hydroxyalkanoic acid synthase [Halomonas sp. HP20-15]MDW5377101.1 class I poly(R)-hydroxyalkanoic acid synthase [Halomonas sp. HP20-15]
MASEWPSEWKALADPELTAQLEAIGLEYQTLMGEMVERIWPSEAASAIYEDMQQSLRAGAEALAGRPDALHQAQLRAAETQWQIWQQAMRDVAGDGNGGELVIEPDPKDRRFKDDAWRQDPFYRFVLQQYLVFARWVESLVDSIDGLDDKQKQNLAFYARQYVSAMSPSNYITTNPEVMRITRETQGQNLVDGLKRLRDDLSNSAEGLNVAMTDREAFHIGENIAVTPGEVIYENELIQLIQYAPTTEQVFKTPLLVVPPWINKYYILDLRSDNSLMRWLVDQGHTVFLISWRNPGREQRDLTWADYMQLGPIAAMGAIEQACGEKSVNLFSYCVGGTLAASTVAYLTSTRRARKVRSVSYLATLQDFSDPGEIGVFINEPILQGIERQLEADGYLDGRVMAFSFNLLRENDLFWSFFVNNYLKGEAPAAFDLLYWNTDGTNLPAATHGWYLRNMYLENRLVEPGGIELDGVKIDLRKISTPSYFVSARDDHIAKWNSTYYGTQYPKGPVTFVLGGSGHIAGIVNPPHKNKYGYWTNDELPPTPEEWFAGATQNEGSWWPHWQAWMTDNGYADASKKVAARKPGDGELKPIEPAPGRYVRQSIPQVLGMLAGAEGHDETAPGGEDAVAESSGGELGQEKQ